MQDELERRVFLLMLALVSVLFLYLLKPFLGPVLWASVIGVLFHPLHRRLLAYWGGRRNLAALATLAACVVIGVIPALLMLGSFFQQGVGLYERLQSGDVDPGAYVEKIPQAFPVIEEVLLRLEIDLNELKQQLAGFAVGVSRFIAHNAVQLGQGTLHFFVSIVLMLYLAFFALRDGAQVVALLVRAVPLGDEREYLLLAKFAEVTRAIVKGTLVVAAVQGALGGLIFWFIGIPGALLWGVAMMLLSLIPVAGTGFIWGPVAIYLLATGEWGAGLILIAFGVGVIGLVDNILRPVLVGRDTKLPDYIVLLSTLGGFVLFGMNGFVVGPLIAALFAAFWGIFMREFNPPPGSGGDQELAGDGRD